MLLNLSPTLLGASIGASNTTIASDDTDENPNKIFLDINLPIKSGWDFLTEIKELNISDIDLYMLTSALDLLDNEVRNAHPEVKEFVEKPLYDYKLESILKE